MVLKPNLGRLVCSLALVGYALLVAGAPAFAGETGKGWDADKAAALAHYESAGRLFDVREYARALEEYKAAYLAKPDPAFLFNIGQCHRKLGQNVQALDFFRQYLKKAASDDPNRPQVEARIADIQAEEQAKGSPPVEPKAEPPRGATSLPRATPAPFPAAAMATPQPAPIAGTDLSLASQSAPTTAGKPIYATWWFWTGVGVVVAGAATTIYLLSSGGGREAPSTAMGNRPVFP